MEPLAVVEDLPINPLDQDRRMNAVLVPMQCLMYGNAMKWDSSTSSGKPTGGERPPGESQPLHTEWQQRYVMAGSLEEREQVIADATDALVKYRCGPRVDVEGETREQWEERLIRDGVGWDASDVAPKFNTGTREVLKIRLKYRRDPSTGRPMAGVTVAQLAQEGLSARQIMAIVPGTAAGTAQYHVNRARKAA